MSSKNDWLIIPATAIYVNKSISSAEVKAHTWTSAAA